MRKNFGPTKYPREKVLDPLNTKDKIFRTHKISTKKKKKWDPRNTREKTIWTHETPKEKKLGPSKA